MKTTRYALPASQPGISFKAAVIADLHDRPYDSILPILHREQPDLILIPGDLTECLGIEDEYTARPGLQLLTECAALAPTFYAFGNHEIGGCHGRIFKEKRRTKGKVSPFSLADGWRKVIADSGATLLDGSFVSWKGLVIGGLGSGLLRADRKPDLTWLDEYTATPGYKVLLCHHPEYFDRYLRAYPIDLTVSGHAHGGQWRFFGRGVYAPDQHLFPKYTSGVHENRLVISRGVSNPFTFIPRIGNPCEVVMVTV